MLFPAVFGEVTAVFVDLSVVLDGLPAVLEEDTEAFDELELPVVFDEVPESVLKPPEIVSNRPSNVLHVDSIMIGKTNNNFFITFFILNPPSGGTDAVVPNNIILSTYR